MWDKLESFDVNGKMLNAIKSLYGTVKCAVRVNNYTTDWFNVTTGLKQGCLLSTTLFNLYINDLSTQLDISRKGISIEGKTINHLFYADDLVIIAENEADLHLLLNILSNWCTVNKMSINGDKIKVMHFRNASVPRTNCILACNNSNIECVERYRYLGLVLNGTLDYGVTVKYVAQAATRALGLLISKFKLMGGMPYEVYTKLYDSMVWPIISYGAAIWGTKDYSAINAVQHRACRFYLGVGKYTPNAAFLTPPIVKQWKPLSAIRLDLIKWTIKD